MRVCMRGCVMYGAVSPELGLGKATTSGMFVHSVHAVASGLSVVFLVSSSAVTYAVLVGCNANYRVVL